MQRDIPTNTVPTKTAGLPSITPTLPFATKRSDRAIIVPLTNRAPENAHTKMRFPRFEVESHATIGARINPMTSLAASRDAMT